MLAFTLLLILPIVAACRFLNWVWFRPRKLEKILRKQGLRGNSYRFLFGDAKETADMYNESYSKPIGINDDIVPRVMPFISKTIRTYGEKSFMWVGPRPLVFIMDPELMKVVMNKHLTFQKSFKISNPIFRNVIGGLIRYEGERWSKNRKKLNPLFHIHKLKEMVIIMQRQCEEVLNRWSTKVPNDGSKTTIDVFPYLTDYTGSVVSWTLFSTPFDEQIKRTFRITAQLTLLANQAQPFSLPGERFLRRDKYLQAKAYEDKLRTTFTNMMNERIKKRKTGEFNGEPDILDMFLDDLNEADMNDPKERAMAVHEVIQQCKLFFIAGDETTSNLIAWTIIMLAYHRQWQARAREEMLQVLAGKDNFTSDDFNQMKILGMIVNEVLRLYPSSIEVTRVVEEETRLGDLWLPKGVMLMLPVILLHRNPRIWGNDVLEFKPERFANGALMAANGHSAFIPFGWGVRKCIGYEMAVWEVKVFLIMLLQRFEFELNPSYEHGPLVSLNMLPQYGIPLVLRRI